MRKTFDSRRRHGCQRKRRTTARSSRQIIEDRAPRAFRNRLAKVKSIHRTGVRTIRLGTSQECVESSPRVSGACQDGTRKFAKRRPRLAGRLSRVVKKLAGKLEPKSFRVPGECQPKGLREISSDAEGKAMDCVARVPSGGPGGCYTVRGAEDPTVDS
ncbi:hypothetical protein B296_00012828 [Ensete ventricosum]|uniref:Uncharacterized protein n=1 Tax=Ensete ventricosum TaxID=4639 RepID=A0A427ACG5_ENSVE|nr:hypothetical protein B296_00012828 [Ensete ventricosum]